MAHNRLRSRHVSKELWDLPYLRVVIITIIYDNDHVLGKNRLAYVKNRRCVACNQLSHSQHQTICTHREQFCSYLLRDSGGVCFLSCFASGRWIFSNPSQYSRMRKITEAIFVVNPAAVEINEAIQPLLDHCPSSTSPCLVVIYIKGRFFIRIDCVNTADSLTAFEKLSKVLGCWKIIIIKSCLVWWNTSGKEHEAKKDKIVGVK